MNNLRCSLAYTSGNEIPHISLHRRPRWRLICFNRPVDKQSRGRVQRARTVIDFESTFVDVHQGGQSHSMCSACAVALPAPETVSHTSAPLSILGPASPNLSSQFCARRPRKIYHVNGSSTSKDTCSVTWRSWTRIPTDQRSTDTHPSLLGSPFSGSAARTTWHHNTILYGVFRVVVPQQCATVYGLQCPH